MLPITVLQFYTVTCFLLEVDALCKISLVHFSRRLYLENSTHIFVSFRAFSKPFPFHRLYSFLLMPHLMVTQVWLIGLSFLMWNCCLLSECHYPLTWSHLLLKWKQSAEHVGQQPKRVWRYFHTDFKGACELIEVTNWVSFFPKVTQILQLWISTTSF